MSVHLVQAAPGFLLLPLLSDYMADAKTHIGSRSATTTVEKVQRQQRVYDSTVLLYVDYPIPRFEISSTEHVRVSVIKDHAEHAGPTRQRDELQYVQQQ